MRKERFAPGEYYHVYNRTILGLPEFKNTANANKLVQTFLLANSTNSSQAFDYLRNDKNSTLERAVEIARKGEKLVDVLCYSIMYEHYHLLLKEIKENGITNFIHKCNTSIAKYINIKNNRRGPLFESNFRARHIDSNEYLLHLSVYVHLNPLDFLANKDWREHKLKDWPLKKERLLNYRWSSLKTFLDEKFKSQITSGTEIILDQFKNRKEYETFLQDWSTDSLESIKDILID